MRPKRNAQSEIVFQLPSAARATTDYFATYDRISAFLDAQPAIIDVVHRDLGQTLARDKHGMPRTRGAKFTSDSVLRLAIVKMYENTSFRETVVRVDDSTRLRAFTRIYNDTMMSHSTLCMLVNAIKPETWQEINRLLAETAVAEGMIQGEQLRLDTTAVETNIHWPTDSGLLWDTYRVLTRLVHHLRKIAPVLANDKRLHAKAAKRLHTRISRTATRKTAKAKLEQKLLYGRLIVLVEGVLAWMPRLVEQARQEAPRLVGSAVDMIAVDAVLQEIEHYGPLGLRAVDQARRRVLGGEQVPNDEKLFSLFEEHTELLIRGKAGKPIEFGHMVSFEQVPGCFITGYDIFDKRPNDNALVDPALARHKRLFGVLPDVLAADKAYWESPEKMAKLMKMVPVVSIGKKGGRTEAEVAREHSPAFRLGQCFRAGIEGSISFLKRALGLTRCLNKGFAHFASTIGAAVFTHNLLVLVRCTG